MIPDLFTGEPGWLVLLCLLLAAFYAFLLYFRERKNEFPQWLKLLSGTMRFLAVFLISFLLLAPFLRSITRVKEKPVIILAVDNSQSLLLDADSNFYRNDFPAGMDELSDALSGIGEPRKYLFGEDLQTISGDGKLEDELSFGDRLTDISGMLSSLDNLYDNRNVGALILATDGIYNVGTNPIYQASGLPFPIYTIALGDTSIRRDAMLLKVNFNRMVYLDNQFPVEVVVHAHASGGTRSQLRISLNGAPAGAQEVLIDKDDFTKTYQFVLSAKQSGLNKIQVILDEIGGELSNANNFKEIYVEALDSRNKVLILSSAPHPDISALKQAILSNQNNEVEDYLLQDFTGNPEAYNLLILHQVPAVGEPATALFNRIEGKKVPVLFILGARSDLVRFNQAKSGLNILAAKNIPEDAVPVFNRNFSAFSLDESTINWFTGLPPLLCPLADYQAGNASRTLLYQRLGSVETTRPMMLFNETLEGRMGVITGEGLWKWRLFDYARNNGHTNFNELVNKTIQYLSLKEQKKQFRIYHQSNYQENQAVEFDAEIYNDSYELITGPDVGITIQNEEGKQFPFIFNKTGNAYHLNAGAFPPGNYSYVARTVEGTQYPSESGQFSVSALDLEALNTIADHRLLFQLADESGGKMFYRDQLRDLQQELLGKEDIKPVTYAQKSYDDLIDKWWFISLILFLLTLEWFMRKRAGGY